MAGRPKMRIGPRMASRGGAVARLGALAAAARLGAAAGTFAALAACATTSPPMHFYVLTAVGEASTSGGNTPGGEAAADIRVQRVIIPGELDRPQIVYGVAGNQLQIAEQERWAAPLDEMIRRVLNEDLARGGASGLGDQGGRSGQGGNAGATLRPVTLEIEEFMPAADCSVSLRATWAANGQRGTLALKTSSPSNACTAADVPAAMSAALGQLSGQLHEAIAKSARTSTAPG